MKSRYVAALSLLAGAAIGGLSIGGLYAQSKSPGAYVIVDISEVTNPDGFKQLFPKAPPPLLHSTGTSLHALRKSPHSMEHRPNDL
jgi:hypothetical protein